jgi:hypothetical protein
MTMPTRLIGAVAALAAAAPLAVPAAASAFRVDQTMQQTLPEASILCARVAAGKERAQLKPFAAQITADCAALQTQFNEAQSKVLTTRAAVLPQIAADRAAVKAACPSPKVMPKGCTLAHRQNAPAIAALSAQWRAAVHGYFATIEAARTQFWTALKAFPGEHHVLADNPIPVPHR